MLSVFEKYVFKNLFIATSVTALSLTLIVLLTQSIRYLELVISSDASVIYFLLMMLLAIPKFLEVILPLAYAIGCIYVVKRLLDDREIVILNASGASFYDIGRVYFIFATVMMIFQFLLSGFLAPIAVSKLEAVQSDVKSHYATLMFREGMFNTLGNGLTVYVEERQGLNEILNLVIHDDKGVINKGEITTVIAKRGIVNLTDTSQQLLIYDGTQYSQKKGEKTISQLDFSQYTLDIPVVGTTVTKRWREPSERLFHKLFINKGNASRLDQSKTSEFVAEIHKRLSSPFLYLSFTMLIIVILFLGEWDRRSNMIPFVKVGGAIMLTQIAHMIIYNEAQDSFLLALMLYAVVGIPIMYGVWKLRSYHAQN